MNHRCPKCHRFGIEMTSCGYEVCIWRNCLWHNKDKLDLSKVEHPIRFHKFIDTIKDKNED